MDLINSQAIDVEKEHEHKNIAFLFAHCAYSDIDSCSVALVYDVFNSIDEYENRYKVPSGTRYYRATDFMKYEDSWVESQGFVTTDKHHYMGQKYKNANLWGPYFHEVYWNPEYSVCILQMDEDQATQYRLMAESALIPVDSTTDFCRSMTEYNHWMHALGSIQRRHWLPDTWLLNHPALALFVYRLSQIAGLPVDPDSVARSEESCREIIRTLNADTTR